MLTIRIALCDDEPSCRAETARLIEKWLSRRSGGGAKPAVFESGQALLEALKRGEQFALYILDVLMPGPNGIEIGKALRNLDGSSEIIYLSSSRDFAVDSYGVGAFYYLLKPVDEGKLFDVLDKALARLELRRGAGIIVSTTNGERRILLDDILYVECVRRRVRYICAGETYESPSLQTSFREIIKPLLTDRRFCSCGASFVLNLQHVRAVNGQSVQLTGGVTLTLPRTACAEFKRLWGEYWLKEGI